MRKLSWRLVGAGGLALLTAAAFFPILFNGYIWDDDYHILWNGNLKGWSGVVEIWTNPQSMSQFYPVYHTLLWAGSRVWGLSAWGYHGMSLALQMVNVLLLWRLLRRLRVRGAWFAAALFAVHPVLVETVGWAMELKSVLSATFYFLALLTLLPLWDVGRERGSGGGENRQRYGRGTLLFLLSMLSKSVTATLPAVILLLVWWKRGRVRTEEVWRSVPLFAMGILAGGYTALLERVRIGAQGSDWNWTFAQRVLIASRAFWMYVRDVVWPWKLNFFYYRWRVDGGDWRQWLWVGAFVGTGAILWALRRRIGRGMLTAFLFFAGTLFPALGFANVYPMRFSFVADHFQYLACIGIFVVAGGAAAWLWGKARGVGLGAGAAVLGVLCVLTFMRCRVFHDGFTLYQDVVAKDWRIWMGQDLLANEYRARGDYRKATEHAAYGVWMCEGTDPDCKEMLEGALAKMGEDGLARRAVLVSGKTKEDRARMRGYIGEVFEMLGDGEAARQVRDAKGE